MWDFSDGVRRCNVSHACRYLVSAIRVKEVLLRYSHQRHLPAMGVASFIPPAVRLAMNARKPVDVSSVSPHDCARIEAPRHQGSSKSLEIVLRSMTLTYGHHCVRMPTLTKNRVSPRAGSRLARQWISLPYHAYAGAWCMAPQTLVLFAPWSYPACTHPRHLMY